jgi:hypothetical protein
VGGEKQDVVESQRLLDDTHGAFLLCAKADYTRLVGAGKRFVGSCAARLTPFARLHYRVVIELQGQRL